MFQIMFLMSLESSWQGRGAWAWFHNVWICGAKVLEYWMISSLKINLNRGRNFWKNWNVPLVLLERDWWGGFNGIYLVIFWIHNVGDIDFKVISIVKNSNRFQKKAGLEGKISWGHGNTWANRRGHTSIIHLVTVWMAHFWPNF
jgi:hypothetical protein